MAAKWVALALAGAVGCSAAHADARHEFLYALADRESSRNHRVENRLGYLGYFQVSELALQDAAFYTADGTRSNDWIGRFTPRAEFVGASSKAEFLEQPGAQELAIREFHDVLWGYVTRRQYDSKVGETIGGVVLTKSGMTAGAHLVGIGGLFRFIRSNGTDIPRDGNGVPITEYLSLFASYY